MPASVPDIAGINTMMEAMTFTAVHLLIPHICPLPLQPAMCTKDLHKLTLSALGRQLVDQPSKAWVKGD